MLVSASYENVGGRFATHCDFAVGLSVKDVVEMSDHLLYMEHFAGGLVESCLFIATRLSPTATGDISGAFMMKSRHKFCLHYRLYRSFRAKSIIFRK